MKLTDKVALVTGAGSGIGKATAVKFAQAGAKVAVLGHTADEINQTGGTAVAIVADIADAASVERAVGQTIDAFGALHIVFANAASTACRPRSKNSRPKNGTRRSRRISPARSTRSNTPSRT